MLSENKRIGWTCSMVPEEIIFAAGMDPVRILEIPERSGPSTEVFPANFCSLVKNYLDIFSDTGNGKLDGLIITPSCNATEFLFDFIKNEDVISYVFMLDTPRKTDEDGVKFFTEQLRLLTKSLEDNFQTIIDRDRLLNAINHFNSIRENLNILKQARVEGRLNSVDFFNLVKKIASGNKQQVLADIEESKHLIINQKDRHGVKKKILLIGTPLMDAGLLDCIEKSGGTVFMDNICTSHTYLSNPVNTEGDLFNNLARSYLQSRVCTRMECKLKRINQVKEALELYKPDGVIYNLSKFKVTDCYDSISLKEEVFDENAPPFLVIENESTSQINLTNVMKIETFLELIQERQGV